MKKLLLITGILFLTFTAQSQSEKKNYKNDDFSIDYPSNWEEVIGAEGTEFAVISPVSSENDKFRENINVIKRSLNGSKMTLDEVIKTNEKEIAGMEGGKLISSKQYVKGKINYHIIFFSASSNGFSFKVKQVYALHNGFLYLVTGTIMNDETEKWMKTATQILESFKLKN